MAGAHDPPDKKAVQNQADELRRRAEDRLDGLYAAAADAAAPQDIAALVHELRVHQIELEMQNEELRRTQLDVDAQRDKYLALFDRAPVGYLTLSDKGMVGDANLTAANLLGVEPRLLVGQPFSAFMFAADRDVYYRHLQLLEQTEAPQTCELRLQRVGAEPFWAHLEWRPKEEGDEPPRYHLTFADVHDRVVAEEALDIASERILERSRRGERLNEALNEVIARLNASFDLDAALDDVLGMACAALECDAALLTRAGLGGKRVDHSFGLELPPEGLVFDAPFLGAVSSDVPLVLAAAESPHAAWLSARLGLAKAIVAHIPAHRGTAGALLFGRTTGERPFDDQATDFVRRLALALALALTNAAQFEAEHHIAESLQEALLVMPPSVRGLEFSHLYRSATFTTRVGGDFYDVFEMVGGPVGVLVGDVSGKGLKAAVLTAIIKDTLKAYAHDTPSPAAAMSHANVALGEAARLPLFASVIFAVVDGARSSLTYCNAGHPPAAVLGAGGSVRLLEGSSPVIGAFPDAVYADLTVPLAPGETVLLYTDGVTEARDPEGVFFEEDGLLAALRSADAADVAGLPAAVFDAVMRFSGGRQIDDIAMLAFRHTGSPLPDAAGG